MADAREFDDGALIELFWSLRGDGWRLVPQQLAQARSVLAMARDMGARDADLPFLLTPLLAKSPAQQAELHARLAALLTPTSGPLLVLPERQETVVLPEPEPLPDVGGRVLQIVMGVALGLLAAGLLGWWLLTRLPPPQTTLQQPDLTSIQPPPHVITEIVVDPSYYAWLTMLGLAPAALLFGWWLARRLRQRAGLGRDDDEGSLDRLDLGARPIAEALFAGPNLALVARQWRRFRRVPTADLDPERTIAETIAMGGMFTPVTATRPLAPEYLLLIEEAGRHDHVARLADNIADRLVDEGVAIRRFYHEGGVASLRAAESGGPCFLSFAELPASERETVVLMGTGAALFDPLTAAPQPVALGELQRWERRVMLSTRPIGEWDDRERMLLDGGFALATAEESGIAALGRHIARGFPPHQGLLQGVLVADDGAPALAGVPRALPELVAELRSRLVAAELVEGEAGEENVFAAIRGLIDEGALADALRRLGPAGSGAPLLDAPRLLAAIRAFLPSDEPSVDVSDVGPRGSFNSLNSPEKPDFDGERTMASDAAMRIYRHGYGSCVLLRLSGKVAPYSVLVNCGILTGSPEGGHRMRAVVNNVVTGTESMIDSVIITRADATNLAGFKLAPHLGIKRLILGWWEDENDQLSREFRARSDRGQLDNANRGIVEDVRRRAGEVRFITPGTRPLPLGETGALLYMLGSGRSSEDLRRARDRQLAFEFAIELADRRVLLFISSVDSVIWQDRLHQKWQARGSDVSGADLLSRATFCSSRLMGKDMPGFESMLRQWLPSLQVLNIPLDREVTLARGWVPPNVETVEKVLRGRGGMVIFGDNDPDHNEVVPDSNEPLYLDLDLSTKHR